MKKLLFTLAFILPLIAIYSCSDDEDKNIYPDITLKVGEKYTIKDDYIGWKSDNELIAQISGNVITARLAGNAHITNGENTFLVTVKPTNFLYEEPCVQWGSSQEYISQYMEKKGYKPLDNNDEEGQMYYGKSPVDYVIYAFKNGKLYSSGVYIPVSYAEELSVFFAQRYVLISQANNTLSFTDPYKSIFIGMKPTIYNNKNYYIIAYGAKE